MAAPVPRTLTPCSHLARKRGVFYFRRVLSRTPRREVAVSLGTRRLGRAEYLAECLNVEFMALLPEAQAMTSTSPDLGALLRAHLKERLKVHLATDASPAGPVPFAMLPLGLLEDGLARTLAALADRDGKEVTQEVADFLQRHSLPQSARDAVRVGLLEADLEVFRQAIRRVRGEVPLLLGEPATEAPPPTLPPPPPPQAAAPAVTASALVEPFFEVRRERHKATGQVIGQERGTLRRFLETCGDKPPADYGRADVSAFLHTLRKLPTTYGRSPKDKDKSLAQIIAEADASNAARLTEKTVKRSTYHSPAFGSAAAGLPRLRGDDSTGGR